MPQLPRQKILDQPKLPAKPKPDEKILAKPPGKPAKVVPATPKKPVQKPAPLKVQKSAVKTKQTAMQQRKPMRPKSDAQVIEANLNKWGRIILDPDVCDKEDGKKKGCKYDADKLTATYRDEKTGNRQTRNHCQLKTLLKIMVDNLRPNQHRKENKAPAFYHDGIGHTSNALGGRVTCKCRWVSLDKTLIVRPVHVHEYLKKRFKLPI